MKYLQLLLCVCLLNLVLYNNKAKAQCNWVKLEIDGLTCSQCSYNVDQTLKRLDFIEDVTTDLNTHESLVEFIEGKKVDLKKIALQVEKAGYSLRSFRFFYQSDSLTIAKNIDVAKIILLSEHNDNGAIKTGIYRLVERKFNDKKYYKNWEKLIKQHQVINSNNKDFLYVVKEN